MTVKELIELLQTFKPEANVIWPDVNFSRKHSDVESTDILGNANGEVELNAPYQEYIFD